MRTITGKIILPPNVPVVCVEQILIEVRDVSFADAPSITLAQQQLRQVTLQTNGHIPFEITVPDVEPNRVLSLYVHVSLDGSGSVRSGDLLTTRHYEVPNSGPVLPLEIAVVVI